MNIDEPVTVSHDRHSPACIAEPAARLKGRRRSCRLKSKTSLNIRFEANSFLVLKDLVQEGLGYTILPTSAFKREQLEPVSDCALVRPKVIRHIVMATRHDHVPNRATVAVEKLLLDEVARPGEEQGMGRVSCVMPALTVCKTSIARK